MKSAVVFGVLFHLVHGNLVCPPGSDTIAVNVQVAGCGLEPCDWRYQDKYQSAFDCNRQCNFLDNCKAFTWADVGDIQHLPSKSVCSFYDTVMPTGNVIEGDSQIMCKPLTCPTGSSQIAGLNAAITDTSKVVDTITSCNNIDDCSTACNNNGGCVSYSWQPNNDGTGANICKLYSTIVPDEEGTNHQILCKKACSLKFTSGVSAYAWGDPHFRTWSNWRHDFMGPHVDGTHTASYYYIKSCDTTDRYSMPFALSATVYAWPNANSAATYGRVWNLEVYTGPLQQDNYYFFWNMYENVAKFGRFPISTLPVYQEIQANSPNALRDFPASGTWTASGTWGDYSLSLVTEMRGTKKWMLWTLKVTRDGHTSSVTFQNHYHRVDVAQMEDYKCFTCGLFGDYHTTYQGYQLLQCDGSVRTVRNDNAHRYLADGWGWEVSYIKNDCTADWGVINEPNYKLQCSDAVRKEAILECQEARTDAATCCYHIGTNYCDTLQYDCEYDACMGAGDDITKVESIVKDEFVEPVDITCARQSKFGPVPKYMWEFDGDFTETMTGGDPEFTLNPTGNVAIEEGRLLCDGNGGTAHTNTLNMNLLEHSFEVLLRLHETHEGGSIMTLELPGVTANDFGFEAISFNQLHRNTAAERVGIATRTQGNIEYHKETESVARWQGHQVIHIVAVFDPVKNELTLYVDGEKEIFESVNANAFITSANGNYEFEFCAAVNLQKLKKETFNGAISFGAFYDKTLTETEAKTLYNMRLPTAFGGEYENIGDELLANDVMYQGQALVSDNGMYAIILTYEGRLIIQDNTGKEMWTAGTTKAVYLKYDDRGRAILFDTNDEALKVIMGRNDDPGNLIMQSDGNFVAYSGRSRKAYGHTGTHVVSAGEDEYNPLLDMSDVFDWENVNAPKDNATINNNSTSEMMMYALYAVIILLSLNIVCMSIQCVMKRNQSNKHAYKQVSIVGTELDTDTEVEVQQEA